MIEEKTVKRMRRAIEFLHMAAREYQLNNMYVEMIDLDCVIAKRQKQLDYYIATHFPIMEKK